MFRAMVLMRVLVEMVGLENAMKTRRGNFRSKESILATISNINPYL